MVHRAFRPDLRRVLDLLCAGILPLLRVQPLTLERRVPRLPCIARRRTVVGFRSRLEHPAADLALLLETPSQIVFAQMPLADDERLVTRFAERLAPQRCLLDPLLRVKT